MLLLLVSREYVVILEVALCVVKTENIPDPLLEAGMVVVLQSVVIVQVKDVLHVHDGPCVKQ